MSDSSTVTSSEGAEPSAVRTNQQGGLFLRGQKYGTTKRLEVLRSYFTILEQNGRVVCTKLSKASKVGVSFAAKFIHDVEHGKPVLNGKRLVPGSHPGIRTLDFDDELVLLRVRENNHQSPLHKYQNELLLQRGKLISIPTIHRYFQKRFPHPAKLKTTSRYPIDKYKPENVIRTHDFKSHLSRLNMRRVKFGDESHKRGADLYSNYARSDPFTGEVAPIILDADFRVAFTIIGLCGIDSDAFAFDFYIHSGINSSGHFVDAIKRSIQKGFLREYDTLVLDNASIHRYGEAKNFDDWLWEHHKIFVLFLPTRSPELNPIELLWNTLSKRMKMIRRGLEGFDNLAKEVAAVVLDQITIKEVYECYKKCGYFV